MAEKLVPDADADFDIWQANLSAIILAHVPGTATPWGYPLARVTALAPFKTAWDTTWAKAKNKGTRTPSDVKDKDKARTAWEKEIRKFVKEFLAFNSLVTDGDRVEMQITVPDTTRTAAPVPTTTPDVDMKPGTGNQIVIFFSEGSDEPGADSIAKPEGVDRMEARYKVGDTPPTGILDCVNTAESGKSPMRIDFAPTDAGKRCYLFFRWVNTRNQPGPWTGTVVSIVIPG